MAIKKTKAYKRLENGKLKPIEFRKKIDYSDGIKTHKITGTSYLTGDLRYLKHNMNKIDTLYAPYLDVLIWGNKTLQHLDVQYISNRISLRYCNLQTLSIRNVDDKKALINIMGNPNMEIKNFPKKMGVLRIDASQWHNLKHHIEDVNEVQIFY